MENVILQPIEVGGQTFKNRIMFPPLTTGYEKNGMISEQDMGFYTRLAKGGEGTCSRTHRCTPHPRWTPLRAAATTLPRWQPVPPWRKRPQHSSKQICKAKRICKEAFVWKT